MAWIKTIEPQDATGALKAHYDRAIKRAGRVYKIVSVMSANPAALAASIEGMYLTLMYGESPLSRAQREMVAVAVSAANACHY